MSLITIARKAGTEFGIQVRNHEVASDMSEADGGRDQGPSPAELLAGSLGACIAMMIQRYCQTHGIDGDVGVSLTMELAKDPKRVGRIVVDVELPDGIPEKKKAAMKRVAEQCPIHETLKNPPELDIEIT